MLQCRECFDICLKSKICKKVSYFRVVEISAHCYHSGVFGINVMQRHQANLIMVLN